MGEGRSLEGVPMAPTIEATISGLGKRAAGIEALAGNRPHVEVERRIKLASATLRACASALGEVAPATVAYVKSKALQYDESTASDDGHATNELASRLAAVSFLISASVATTSYEKILESGSDIANGRDREALKRFAALAGVAVGTLAATASGLEAAKTVGELVSVLRDSVEVGRAPRLRKHQAGDASEFLRWIDAVATVGGIWLSGVDRYLRVTRGKRALTEAGTIRAVARRVRAELH